MADVLMVLTILVFFLACVAYVGWCGRIIGPDPETNDATPTDLASDVAAGELTVTR